MVRFSVVIVIVSRKVFSVISMFITFCGNRWNELKMVITMNKMVNYGIVILFFSSLFVLDSCLIRVVSRMRNGVSIITRSILEIIVAFFVFGLMV